MIIDCAHYEAGARQTEATSFADAARLSRAGSGFVWLALSEAGSDELRELGALFELPALAVEDAREDHERPKLEEYGECVFLVVKTVRYDQTTVLDIGELDVFLGSQYAIVVSRSGTDVLAGARSRLDEHPKITALGPMAGLWAALDTVIDDAEHVTDLLDDQLDEIEQAVFEADRDQSEPIYLHHRRVERLARAVHPVLAIFDTLERGLPVESPEALRPSLTQVGDHARRLSEEVVILLGGLDALLNANLARVTVRQNVIVQKVSAWAAIAAVPTIITGIYGMNFRHFPELGWPFGYPLALVVMVFAVGALRWNFRRLGWL